MIKQAGALSLGAVLGGKAPSSRLAGGPQTIESRRETRRLTLRDVTMALGSTEPAFVRHAALDLADYLKEITGTEVRIESHLRKGAHALVLVGREMARQFDPALLEGRRLGKEGFLLQHNTESGGLRLIVTGAEARGTNYGLAALMSMICREGRIAYVEIPAQVESRPWLAVRGLHLNGWPLRHPYSFRSWTESDWQRFIDILWLERANLFLLWPFMEIIPVPLSREDAAYLEEVRRVVDYAQRQRGMEIWIMHSANRIATADCGANDPRERPYWLNHCQKDMNPGEPAQFERILQSFDALYSIVNNADGYAMIDSDPGGWPGSPIGDQLKIFQAARKLLDQHHARGREAKLIDWMWVGWGRHKLPSATESVVSQYDWTEKNPDASDLTFMGETIRTFKHGLAEPWGLLAGFAPYLEVCREEGVLAKTTFLPYGAIEYEPAFPSTNASLDPIRGALGALENHPETLGVMGNNQTALLQFPRTYFLLTGAWDYDYRKQDDRRVLRDLAERLYPEHADLIVECYSQLEGNDLAQIESARARLEARVERRDLSRPGALGRKLFPDALAIARSLVFQLRIRAARERLLQVRRSVTTTADCQELVTNYLDALLAWNQETGWDKLIELGVWRTPIYASDRRLSEALAIVKRIVVEGSGGARYPSIVSFFDSVRARLAQKYGEDSVMVGCIEPLKLAVIQSP